MAASTAAAPRKGVAVFSSDPAMRRRLVDILTNLGRYGVRELEVSAFFETREPPADQQIVVLDLGEGALLSDPRLVAARERQANSPIIAVSGAITPDSARLVVRLGVSDWLQAPFSDDDFLASLAHAEGAHAGAHSQVSTFISASGGAGGTTLALMAAYHLARSSSTAQACVVDLDFQSGSCGNYLNLTNEFDLETLIANPDRLDGELLELIKLERPPGMTVYSFERPDVLFSQVARRFVLRLLDLVAARHRNTIIDLPNLATPWFDDVILNSDNVFVIFELNIPSLRQARRTIRRVRELRPGREVIAIANKAVIKLFGNTISRKDVAKMLADTKIRTVVRDDNLAVDALNRALLPNEAAPRSKLVKDADHIFASTLKN